MSNIIESNSTINEYGKKNPNVFSRIKKKLSSHIKDLGDLFKMPDNEKARNAFSEETKKEMEESLSMKNIVDLYSIDIKNLSEPTFLDHETVDFKKGVIKQDSIGKYIEIDGLKCRQWQPGITGFTYEDIRSRYYINQRLRIGFCNKGKFDKEITINSTGKPKTAEGMPHDTEKKLGGPFYEINNPKDFQSSKYYGISWQSLYHTNGEKELGISDNLGPWVINNGKKELHINGINFIPFEKGVSGFVYQEFPSIYGESEHCILIGEFKNGKLIGEGVIIDAYKRTFVKSANQDNDKD